MSDKVNQKNKNVVHDDEIWRQTVKFEKDTAQQWNSSWGFMTDSLYGKDNNIKEKSFLPEIENTNSVFPVRKNRKRPSIIKNFLLTYQIEKAMKYEAPIKNYTYPYSTNTEIGWPWCNGFSNDNTLDKSNNNKIFDYLPKCQCRNGVLSVSNEDNCDEYKYNLDSKDIDEQISTKQFIKNEKLIDNIQKHGSDQYKLRNPMRWWGGCIESLP
ncbi:hypothetical protein BCR36DRAFT_355324 [Piromyces finnis]|uniref:Uncharacterized protein n=1 Tax=Piromyces finnis TaxID=1754191 RepID=A0A1Y1V5N1_9FUNG|nr:hypothetical protein BCR36DRAFT_355324 [Piromyces finnis]|eukprot:ORX47878.1 hypothetical protein BCR36DRAFT_355324 [Piromyces finnis]